MDSFEDEVREMFAERVAGIPEPRDTTPALVARARRRRTTKLAALVATVVVVAGGTTAALAQVAGRHGPERVATAPESTTSTSIPVTTVPSSTSTTAPDSATTTTKPSVSTVICPINYTITTSNPLPAPDVSPRVPSAGDPASYGRFSSFAATIDPRFVVLGPKGWSCDSTVATDGQDGMTVAPPATGTNVVPISIINDYLWHGGVGSTLACSVFDDPALVQYLTQNFPEMLPCPHAGRTVTRVDAHVSTFVDADGTRGVGWMVLPSTPNGDDGMLSVLTCRPTAGLTAGDCDTVINDYLARLQTRVAG